MTEETKGIQETEIETLTATETPSEITEKSTQFKEQTELKVKPAISNIDSKYSNSTSKAYSGSKQSDLLSMKIRKRTLDASNQSDGFSRRDNLSIPSRRGPQLQTQQPSWASKLKPAKQKPVWMSDEDFKKLQKKEHSQDQGEPNFKRAVRRDGLEEQSAYTKDSRETIDRRSEEEKELDYKIRQEIQMKQKNLDNVVRQHYNERAFHSKRERRNLSPIIKLRNYHNAIKYILINNNTQPGQRVLDLGCGKGGDINKWEMAKVSEYIGIDISNASIVEAVKRYKSRRAHFEVTFITGDCFSQPLPNVLQGHPHIRFPVDVVSMQFCMHYAFETEAKARQMLENVSRSLAEGGMFIGTIPSSDFIREKIKTMPPDTKKFGNSIYSVAFLNDLPRNGIFEQPYGNIYNYYLKDAIDNVPEYVVPFESFRALAQEYGLFLKFKKPFADLFKEEIPIWYKRLSPNMINGMKRSDGKIGLEGEETEASAFYCAFAFVKT